MNDPITRLTELPEAERAAFTPEQRELWRRQGDQDSDDHFFLMSFAGDLYPPLRKYFKRARAERSGDFSKGSGGPLFEVFESLLTLLEDFGKDPEMAERLWRQVRRRKAREQAGGRTPGRLAPALVPESSPIPGTCPAQEDRRPDPGSRCADCGSATDINSARCPVCRRFIE